MAMIRFRYTLVTILAALALHSSVRVNAATPQNLSMTVAYLREGDRIGSGFLVRAEQPFLVTAGHVAEVLTVDSFLTVRADGDRPVNVKLGDLVPGSKILPWVKHAEGDAAVLRLATVERLGSPDQRFFPVQLLPFSEAAPARELFVTVMGFPLALGTVGRFSPITSEAKAASGLLRLGRFDTGKEATFFILDKPSVGGFSGAPVFLLAQPVYSQRGFSLPGGTDNPARCVGLVHGTISDNTGGKFAAVVPASVIVETIKAAGGKTQDK